ncbi:Cj0069 family protein [Bacillus solimangrovi]|uniref:DUF6815 domain-containing protein n=1 Tax=Bacillus solimangrovi TaxID=1305675 RepID=A0A1E5LBS9_9BACI|nr:Cj0069 family protein [Bacillus solimangrovi]OEH91532.1 hypothetical protein BFG57_05310 [Bacillus solimangrovi]
MKKKVVFFEVREGTDKGPDGYRPDTMPMVNALNERDWEAEVIFYSDDKKDEILEKVLTEADAYVSRINPGNLKSEKVYFEMLHELVNNGVIGMAHPDAMSKYGAKDALVKLRDTDLVPSDTFSYYEIEEFKRNFPKQLANGERVLKQNRGSTGEGIWRVVLIDIDAIDQHGSVKLDAKVRCTEAKDNHVEERELGEFMEFCEQYIVGDNGMLVDMPFLHRIKEGEIRIFMINDKPMNVVHKKPADGDDAFSATLFSGAKYRYDKPEEWQELMDLFTGNLQSITEKLGGYDLPLIWTADFILDTDEQGNDCYVLGEMNCSCVGFTSHLSLAHHVADEVISIIKQADEVECHK